MGGSLKDRLGAILAVLGFIIICVIYVRMRVADGGINEKVFDPYGYYVPEQRSAANEQITYAEYNLGRLNSCKQKTLLQAKTISFAGTGDKTLKCFFLSASEYRNWAEDKTVVPAKGQVCSDLSLDSNGGSTDKEEKRVLDMINKDWLGGTAVTSVDAVRNYNDEYFNAHYAGVNYIYEIVSPFTFKFQNVNNSGTLDNQEIIIVSTDGKYRITFSHVANWFCAGEPGEPSDYEKDNVDSSWLNHMHQTIVGNSGNSKVKNGPAGMIIGYGKDDTTVKFEKKNNSGWEVIKFGDMIK